MNRSSTCLHVLHFYYRIQEPTSFMEPPTGAVDKIEVDRQNQSRIMYSEGGALYTSDGISRTFILSSGSIRFFTQLSCSKILIANRNVTQTVNRSTGSVQDLILNYPPGVTPSCFVTDMFMDKINNSQVIVSCWFFGRLVATVDFVTGDINALTDQTLGIEGVTQHDNGDIYFTSQRTIHMISYSSKTVTPLNIADAPFRALRHIQFISEDILIVAGFQNNQLYLVDLAERNFTSIDACPEDNPLRSCGPTTVLVTKDYLYAGYNSIPLQKFARKYLPILFDE